MSRSRAPSFAKLLETAHGLADLSAGAIAPYFRKALAVENKAGRGAFDPVTKADRAAERAIRKALAKEWPAHGVVGEEFDDYEGEGRFDWVIDPIDGTRAFIMGYPLWGTLIGLIDDGEPLLGIMDQPFTGERFWSGAKHSYLRRFDGRAKRLKTRTGVRLCDAVLATTHPDLFARGADSRGFEALKGKANMTRYGGDCYIYCMLAAGFVDLIVETGLKPHDIVALIPIVERAGGKISTWEGASAVDGGRIIAAGDARLHKEAMKVLSAKAR